MQERSRNEVTSIQPKFDFIVQGGYKIDIFLFSTYWSMPSLLLQVTPLHCAAEYGHCSIVEQLVNKGAQIDSRDNHHVWSGSWSRMYSLTKGVHNWLCETAWVSTTHYHPLVDLHHRSCHFSLQTVWCSISCCMYMVWQEYGQSYTIHKS